MRSLCCFVHPAKDRTPKELDETCPTCGRPYGFPLATPPSAVGRFTIDHPLDRGFYGATYVATDNLGKRRVLKVVPVEIYAFFGKDFVAESRRQVEVAAESTHIIDIDDAFDTDVTFGDVTLRCHVAVLQYAAGPTLARFLEEGRCSAKQAAQIAIDLFTILEELDRRQVRHNDLHGGNLIVHTLDAIGARANAVDPYLIVKVIDLGSLDDVSRSDPEHGRLGDVGQVARHLDTFVEQILRDPDNQRDVEFRLARELSELAFSLGGDPSKSRLPSYQELAEQVRRAFEFVSSPLNPPTHLRTFGEGYNAQELDAAWIPELLVDPEGQWTKEVAQAGPVVIHGMRGCGKTLLLRTLQFQARCSHFVSTRTDSEGRRRAIVDGLEADGFLGLYVSCNRLLDSDLRQRNAVHEPTARLFLAYAREAIRAVRVLRSISPEADRVMSPGWLPRIGEVVANHIVGAADVTDAATEIDLEHRLQMMLMSLNRGEATYRLPAHPANAFTDLAEAVRSTAEIWRDAPVYFLLDDVSTRHLTPDSVQTLLSQVLFLNPTCAFKLTTETQTMELLRSPGLVEPARIGRDYQVFDLGAAVNERLRRRNDARAFIADILRRRSRFVGVSGADQVEPATLLGDETLERIAMSAAAAREGAKERKGIYHGIGALAKVCVGDIGDVIQIYDMMLNRRSEDEVPIPPRIQSACFQDYCNRQMFRLNVRDRKLLDAARTFAEASRDLLVASHKEALTASAHGKKPRIRQYTSLHLNISTGDAAEQFGRVRDLVDAGVFVFKGGAQTPRMKTRDSNPIQQFTLTFRKLLGISNFIGLAERDRFELSGKDVEAWLANPAGGKEILLRNPAAGVEPDADETEDLEGSTEVAEPSPPRRKRRARQAPQLVLRFDQATADVEQVLRRLPTVEEIGPSSDIDATNLIAGLGFEERTLRSTRRLVERTAGGLATVVRYGEPGRSGRILASLDRGGWNVEEVEYSPSGMFATNRLDAGPILIDVTGLAKPMIFAAVRLGLERHGSVLVAHTEAKTYYPRDEDIAPIIEGAGGDPYALLSKLGEIWRSDDPEYRGEAGPYKFRPLLEGEADESRGRLLIASVSPKHQRLLSLVESRDYDRIEFLVPAGDSPRSQLALHASRVVADVVPESDTRLLGSNDLSGAVEFVAERYDRWYGTAGYSVELGLTGSKLQTVAFAAVSMTRKMAQAWYVQPRAFDADRFTEGVGRTRVFRITLPRETDVEADTILTGPTARR